jgi:hypothetical protein
VLKENRQVFARKYRLQLPSEDELAAEIMSCSDLSSTAIREAASLATPSRSQVQPTIAKS